MSARPDIRQIQISPSNAPGVPSNGPSASPGASQHHPHPMYRHPALHARHGPGTSYHLPVAVDAANKVMRGPQSVNSGQPPVSIASLTLGRSSSPAALRPGFPPGTSAYIASNHRQSSQDPGVRYVYPTQGGQAAQSQQYATLQREQASAFVRSQAERVSGPSPSSHGVPATSSQASLQQQQNRSTPIRGHPQSVYPDPAYLRDVSVIGGHHASLVASTAELPNKRSRLEMSQTVATPLTIDTREAVKESMYHPQVEAISPTGPEAPGERDDLKAIKEELLKKITKVDREILKAESQIAKLKKKQQELEDVTSKPSTDSSEELERPKNQSISQIIYAENRKKAKDSHAMLENCALVNTELPLYNQPSDTSIYHTNKRNHAHFKKVLVEHFKRKNEEKETYERQAAETYSKINAIWLKKVERLENSKKRKEKEAKARELYEKIFPELRKQREDKERDHRLGSRGAVRSEADIEDVIERLQEQEMEDKKMHSYAVIPPLMLPPDARRRRFINTNGFIPDPLRVYSERKFFNVWTDQEKETFKEKFLLHPKNFGQIAQFLERKSITECVEYYYLSKKTENYKQLLRKSKMRRRGRAQPAQVDTSVINSVPGVVTRHRNKNEDKGETSNNHDEVGGSNRSTPQPSSIKTEIKEEKNEDSGDKKSKTNKEQRNDTSEEDEGPVKSGPHQCSVCKTTVELSRAVTQKSLALLLGLKEEDVGSETRACNACYARAQRKKHALCPVPGCTSVKGRVKGRLRHIGKKLSDLPKDIREVVANELHMTDSIKKCCSVCFNKLTKKIASLNGSIGSGEHKAEGPDPLWTDDDVETLKSCLRVNGRNWNHLAEKLANKTSDQCKKFFYQNRKKYQLDKIVMEYKRANASGDQPPSLSTDEESGSSTSSCEEDAALQSATASGSSSPARRNHVDKACADVKPPVKQEKLEIKTESIKTELKTEDEPMPLTGAIVKPHPMTGVVTKEEEYDSSATISADERESEMNPPRLPYATVPGQMFARGDVKPFPAASGSAVPERIPQQFAMPLEVRRSPFSHSQVTIAPVRPPTSSATSAPTSNGPRETITVKELMLNVIERSLSTTSGTTVSPSVPQPSPTIHNLLENSRGLPHKTNYVRDRVGLIPLSQQSGKMETLHPMGPPSAVPRAPAQPSNECETLDLSMPKKRDVATPPSVASAVNMQYREPVLPGHSSSLGGRVEQPPPAHGGNKVKTIHEAFIRREPSPASSAYLPQVDSRRLATPPHLPGAQPGRGPTQVPTRPQLYGATPLQHRMPCKPGTVSPHESDRPLTIQTSGSITQGTPVNPNAARSYEPLLKATPPGSDKGSITQGTPVYEKKHHLIAFQQEPGVKGYVGAEYLRRGETSSAATAQAYYVGQGQGRAVGYSSDPHMSSRQVLMNDYAMARSTDMQRRPESREHHPSPPGMLPSPRSRTIDPRSASAQLEVVRQRGSDRYEGRALPEARGDPRADIPSSLQQHRSDPRAGLPDPKRPSSIERGDPRIIDSRLDPRYAAAGRPGFQPPLYLPSDTRYSASSAHQRDSHSMSPPRNTPPPRSMAATIVQQRSTPVGAKMGRAEVEIYRAHPEVTISKTNSPRHGYNDQNPLASLVDVAIQQPKLPDLKDRQLLLHQQAQRPQSDRGKYEYESNRFGGQPGSFDPRGLASGSSQIVQQVRVERSKQQYFLQGDRPSDRGYHPVTSGSAARITSAPSELAAKALQRPPSNGARDAPAVIINERGVPHSESRTVTAATLIDAIITHSINSGPAADGGASMPPRAFQYKRSPGASVSELGQDGGKASPYSKISNGPTEDSRSSDLPRGSITMSAHMEQLINKDLSIQPATSDSGSDVWKKRNYSDQLRTAAAVTTGAPRNAASLVHGDERQITRVAQMISPRHPGIEPISPPQQRPSSHGSNQGGGDPIARFLDAQKRLSQSSDGGKGAPSPGLSPLDYVKNKIVEEMKKGEGSSTTDLSKNRSCNESQGSKRSLPAEGTSNNGATDSKSESPRKKMRLDPQENDLPDSPGSGEMVIDESVRPESASSQKTASPVPSSQPATSGATTTNSTSNEK